MQKKILIVAFIFVFLSIPVATYLVKQNQDNREHATGLTPTSSPSPTQTQNLTLDSEEWNFLSIINAHRQSLGLSTLKISTTLETAAKWEANDLATRGVLSHTDSLGRDPDTRMKAFGYPGNADAENVAATSGDAQTAFNQFMTACDADSSGTCQYTHKVNIERPNMNAIGISRQTYSTGQYQGNYAWVTDFGSVLDSEITPPEGTSQTPTTPPTESASPSPTTIIVTTIPISGTSTPTPTIAPISPTLTQTLSPTTVVGTPTLTPTLTSTPTFTPTPTPTSTISVSPTQISQTPTPTPSIANPGGIGQTFGIIALGIGIILGGIFLLAL